MAKLQTRATASHEQELMQKQSYWSGIVADWNKNPISPREFCNKRHINKDQFYYWRRKFNKSLNLNDTPSKTSKFIELVTPDFQPRQEDKIVVADGGAVLNITLANHVVITVTIPTVDIGMVIKQLAGCL